MNRPSSPHDTFLFAAKCESQRRKVQWWGQQPKVQASDKPKGDYEKKRLIKYNTW